MCVDCNCEGCSNELEDEEVIEKAKNGIKLKLNIASNNLDSENSENVEINPINVEGAEVKLGCNCTKSNCNKKYCECYKSNSKCNDKCRCRDCSNSIYPHSHFKKKRKNYPYNGFVIEKISVYIKSENLVIDKFSTYDLFGFSYLSFKFDNENLVLNQYNKTSNNDCIYNEIVELKEIDNEMIIEIPKNILNITNEFSTPNINLTKKRKRIRSDNSKQTYFNNDSIKNERTCWQTDKKETKKEPQNLIPKKLEYIYY